MNKVQIAEAVLLDLSFTERCMLKTMQREELIRLHHYLGMHIRNEYGLWSPSHPLTANWHNNVDGRIMDNGFDVSPDHPDQVSMDIMEIVWDKIHEECAESALATELSKTLPR